MNTAAVCPSCQKRPTVSGSVGPFLCLPLVPFIGWSALEDCCTDCASSRKFMAALCWAVLLGGMVLGSIIYFV
jgi:hypothetical protein